MIEDNKHISEECTPDEPCSDCIDNHDIENGNIKCECGRRFYGLEVKEDTCNNCLKEIIK